MPAMKYRFSNDIYESLLNINFSRFNRSFVDKNIDVLYKEITSKADVDQFSSLIPNGIYIIFRLTFGVI